MFLVNSYPCDIFLIDQTSQIVDNINAPKITNETIQYKGVTNSGININNIKLINASKPAPPNNVKETYSNGLRFDFTNNPIRARIAKIIIVTPNVVANICQGRESPINPSKYPIDIE